VLFFSPYVLVARNLQTRTAYEPPLFFFSLARQGNPVYAFSERENFFLSPSPLGMRWTYTTDSLFFMGCLPSDMNLPYRSAIQREKKFELVIKVQFSFFFLWYFFFFLSLPPPRKRPPCRRGRFPPPSAAHHNIHSHVVAPPTFRRRGSSALRIRPFAPLKYQTSLSPLLFIPFPAPHRSVRSFPAGEIAKISTLSCLSCKKFFFFLFPSLFRSWDERSNTAS